jgi:GAF domain-containing protein
MDTRWSGEAKYQALLAVAQAANSRRDLSSVLQAVADALEGLVSVDAIIVFTYEGDWARNRAMYLRGVPRRSGESQQAYLRRFSAAAGAADGTYVARLRDAIERDRRTLVFDSVQNEARLEGTAGQRAGAECGVVVPLTMGEAFVAGLAFGRMTPHPFLCDEVQILEDVARPVTTAVANALAFEEIGTLRGLLEDENLALREEIAAGAAADGSSGP